MDERTRERMEIMNGGPLPPAAVSLYNQVVTMCERIHGPSELSTMLSALILAMPRVQAPVEPRPGPPSGSRSLTKEDAGREFRRNGSVGTFVGRGPRGFYKVVIDEEELLLNPEVFSKECELIDGGIKS